MIEDMAENNYQWTNEWGNSRRQTGMIEMDTLNMLSVQMNNIVKLLSRVGVSSSSSSSVYVACCFTCGGDHDTNECVEFE